MLRDGSGEPLVLLHGVTGTAQIWRHVVPRLAPHHDVIAPTALGHLGGTPVSLRPARVAHLVDDLERRLDGFGIDQAHFAGNSLGGWMALEMARRERALTVCALSPAGIWDGTTQEHTATRDELRRMVKEARRGRLLAPLALRSARMRRHSLRLNAEHGDRVSREDMLAGMRGLFGCEVLEDILSTPEQVALLDPPPCPITIAWSGEDKVLPLATNGLRARDVIVPGARFLVLDGVGHVPFFDDPELVARTILVATGALREDASAA